MKIFLNVCMWMLLNACVIPLSCQAETMNWSAMVGPHDPSILQTHLDLPTGHYSLSVSNATNGILVQGSTELVHWPDQTQFTSAGGSVDVYFTVSDITNVVDVQYTLTPDSGNPIIGTLVYTPDNTAVSDLPVTTDGSQAVITVRDLGSLGSISYPLTSGKGSITSPTDTGDIMTTALDDYSSKDITTSATVYPGAQLTLSGQAAMDLGIIGWQATVNGNTITGSQIIKSSISTIDLKRLGIFKLTLDSKVKAWVTIPDAASVVTKTGVSVFIVPFGSGTGSARFNSFPSDIADLSAGMYEVFVKANAQSDPIIVQIVSDTSTPSSKYQYLAGIADFNGHRLPDLSTTSLSDYQVNFNDDLVASPTDVIIGYTDVFWEESFRVSSANPSTTFKASGTKYHLIAYNLEANAPAKRNMWIKGADGAIVYSAFLQPNAMQLVFPLANYQPGSMTVTTNAYTFPASSLSHVEMFAWDESGNVHLGFTCEPQCSDPFQYDLVDPANLYFTFDPVPTATDSLLGVTVDYQPSSSSSVQGPDNSNGKPGSSSNNANSSATGSGGGGFAPWMVFILSCFCYQRIKASRQSVIS